MAVEHISQCQMSGPVYLENAAGHILLPMSMENARFIAADPRYAAYEIRQARTWAETLALQKRMQEQERKQCEADLARDNAVMSEGRRQVRERLKARAASADCPIHERDLILAWLEYRDGIKRKAFEDKFLKQNSYFEAVEFSNSHHIADVADRA